MSGPGEETKAPATTAVSVQAQDRHPVLSDWNPLQVKAQLSAITELMRDSMVKDEDYGIIHGCKKPSLLKPGAEKLGLMFRLAPSYEFTTKDLGNGHREVITICTFTHIPTGTVMGQGVGSCSTMESKFRWRSKKTEDELTDVQVPKAFWDRRNDKKNPASPAELNEILAKAVGAPGRYGTKKPDNVWVITKRGERTEEREENPDIADQYNTVLKISKKRSQVDGALTCTAASQIFTQDVEEMANTVTTDAEVVETVHPTQPQQPEKQESTSEESAEAKDVRKRSNAINDVTKLGALKQACREQGGAWWTAEVNDILNARYYHITGERPSKEAQAFKKEGAN